MQCEGTLLRCKILTLVAQPEADHEGSGEKIALGMERQGGNEGVRREIRGKTLWDQAPEAVLWR